LQAQSSSKQVTDSTKDNNLKTNVTPKSVVDEVVWVVGDEAILKSDIEATIQSSQDQKWNGDPYCVVPEQLAIQKLFLHQAVIDSVDVPEAQISKATENQLNMMIKYAGSREKLEEYHNKTISQIREQLHDQVKDYMTAEEMRNKITKDIKVTPAEVRRYFKDLPADSIPYIPTEVEVQIITLQPKVPQSEIDRVKEQLRSYSERISSGETSFSTLAKLYSEDASARNGGELDYEGRGMLDPAFAAVAFSLTDPNKVSKIVKSEFGYHIIQLIDKRGDKVKVRHILLRPKVSDSDITAAINRLDSIADDIRNKKFSFEDAVGALSDDKETRNSRGLMVLKDDNGDPVSSKFRLQDLPSEVAKVVNNMNIGEISKAFTMKNNNGMDVCAVVKLKSKINGHKASVLDDFQLLKNVVLNQRQSAKIDDWIREKQKTTYIRINDAWKNCNFKYPGWIK
jgi:peptidyl-prolyl cis-trans isomerase SurA